MFHRSDFLYDNIHFPSIMRKVSVVVIWRNSSSAYPSVSDSSQSHLIAFLEGIHAFKRLYFGAILSLMTIWKWYMETTWNIQVNLTHVQIHFCQQTKSFLPSWIDALSWTSETIGINLKNRNWHDSEANGIIEGPLNHWTWAQACQAVIFTPNHWSNLVLGLN